MLFLAINKILLTAKNGELCYFQTENHAKSLIITVDLA